MDLWTRLLILVAGLFGTAGVVSAAIAAHVGGGTNIESASHFLLFNAATLAGLAALALQLSRGGLLLKIGATAIALGTLLFTSDLAVRVLEIRLPTGSAPFGGSLMILGWLIVAATAPLARRY